MHFSSELLFYNKYTVYPQSLCIKMPAERLLFLKLFGVWISLSDSSYVTTAVESDSSLPQTCKSGSNEAGDILHHSVCIYQDVYVCACYSVCCLSQWRLLPLCRLMAPMSLLHESLNTFIIPSCPCHDEYFSPTGLVYTNLLQVYIIICLTKKYIYPHEHTCTHWNHAAVMQVKTRFSSFFFLIIQI